MHSATGWLRKARGSLRVWLCLAIAVCGLVPAYLWADAPAWWAEYEVFKPNITEADRDDFAVANQGQLKNIATMAAAEMNARLPGGAGLSINTLVEAWSSDPLPSVIRDDYAAINIGQLKSVAALFYLRLRELNYTGQPFPLGQPPTAELPYPWSTSGKPLDDYALANIGQVKNLFSFLIIAPPLPDDADGDGLSDAWEVLHFGNITSQTGTGNADGDGMTNAAEMAAGTNPNVAAAAVTSASLSLEVYSP